MPTLEFNDVAFYFPGADSKTFICVELRQHLLDRYNFARTIGTHVGIFDMFYYVLFTIQCLFGMS